MERREEMRREVTGKLSCVERYERRREDMEN